MAKPAPCSCPTFNPECLRRGLPMTERTWGLCSGKGCTAAQSEAYRRLWDKLPPDEPPPAPPAETQAPVYCRHRGEVIEQVQCGTCPAGRRIKVFSCSEFGQCQIMPTLPGVQACKGCPRFDPNTYALVSPLGTREAGGYRGSTSKRPWQFPATVAIPHLNTPDILETCVELFRLQGVRPYLLVIDTGSPPDVCERLEAMRAVDLEVHRIAAHGYPHSSSPVTAAMDLAFALCRTEKLIGTHADVFLRRRDAVSWLTNQVSEATPVVGWQMSPRRAPQRWRDVPSHTFTGYHMPTLRRIGATWSMERFMEARARDASISGSWDTEHTFHLCLVEAGIQAKLLGPEKNFQLDGAAASFLGDDRVWYDHARSATFASLHSDRALAQKVAAYVEQALADARQRVNEWREADARAAASA